MCSCLMLQRLVGEDVLFTAAAAAQQVAKELIEEETLTTLEARERVTTETKRREWTEREGFYWHRLCTCIHRVGQNSSI